MREHQVDYQFQTSAQLAIKPVVTLYTTLCGEHQIIPSTSNLHDTGTPPPDDREKRSIDSLSVVCSPSLLIAHPDTHAIRNKKMQPVLFGTIGLVIGGVFLIICFVLLICYIIYRRNLPHYAQPISPTAQMHQPYIPYDDMGVPAIPVQQFEHYVTMRHANGDEAFVNEYEKIESHSRSLESDGVVTSHYSLMPINRTKNRYINILAYDHTRVILKSNNVPGSDYINANYVDGYHKPRAYIATQGPLPHTFTDFWRMIWEQRCGVVVMITNVVERGRKKCDQYWPSEGSETYGGCWQVRLLNQHQTAYYVQRVFAIRNLKCIPRPAERVIFHYHYTHWPDHGVPSNPLPVLNFIRKSAEANRDSCAGPVVVHCSAGVGRSGTYIVVDAMLHQIRQRNTINIHAFLRHIRQQRNFLVQTEEQYIFCHDVVLAAIQSGVTEIPTTNLPFYIEHMLGEIDVNTKRTLLEHQYQLVTATVREPESSETSTLQRQYSSLIRQNELSPMDEGRVILDTTYINATWLQGYNRQDEFIITQAPMEKTIESFWQMIWQYNVRTIVLLCDIVQPKDTMPQHQSFPQFWPDAISDVNSIDYGQFRLQYVNEWLAESWQCIQLLLSSKDEDFQLTTRLIHAPYWPAVCQPKDTIWDLVRCVCRIQSDGTDTVTTNPVVVVDKFGGNVSATFCALSTLAVQLEQDSSVDVYTLARLYHTRRPNVWPTLVNYQLLYDAVRHLLREDGSTQMTADSSGGSSGALDTVTCQVPQAQSAPQKLDTLVVMHGNGCVTKSVIGRDVTL